MKTSSLPRLFLWMCLLVPAIGFWGCSAYSRPKRPGPGDTVQTQVIVGKGWKTGEYVMASARLRVFDKDGLDGGFLQFEDIPHTAVPMATVTFFEEGKELEHWADVPLTRDC